MSEVASARAHRPQSPPERRRWYDCLLAAGWLDAPRLRDDWQGRENIMRNFGFLFFGLGLVLLGLIVYAMASRLGH